jgi:hypothetical protein
MDWEIGFTPDDAQLQFTFMERSFEVGCEAISSWSDETEEKIHQLLAEASTVRKLDPVIEKHRQEERHLEIDNMLQQHCRSYFLSAFSLLEASATMFTVLFLKKSKSKFRINDFSGTGIERAKIVASKLGGSSEGFENQVWEEIKALREIRNCLVHKHGILDSPEAIKSVFRLTERMSGIELRDFGTPEIKRLVLQNLFIHHAISKFREFAEYLARVLFCEAR